MIGQHLAWFGRRRALALAVGVVTIATAVFAMGGLFENDILFYIVSLVGRCTQGFGEAILIISIPSIIALEYPENKEKYIGYSNMSGAIGLTLGPVIASFLSKYFDYVGTLLVFSVLILVVGCVAVF